MKETESDNSKLKEFWKKTRYEVLKDILVEDIDKKLTKDEIYDMYRYIFYVQEKANSICKPINIPLEEIYDFIRELGKILEKNYDLDFQELSIKQKGDRLEFINKNGEITGLF